MNDFNEWNLIMKVLRPDNLDDKWNKYECFSTFLINLQL